MVAPNVNINSFTDRISDLTSTDAEKLESLVEQNPWCAAYRILLARCYENEQSFLAEKKLNIASLYTGNRETLFYWIHEKQSSPIVKTGETLEMVSSDLLGGISENEQAEDTSLGVNEELENHFDLIGPVTPAEESEESNDVPASLKSQTAGFKLDLEEIIQYDPTRDLVPNETVQEQKIEIPFDRLGYNPEVELLKFIEIKTSEKSEQDTSDSADNKHDFLFWLNELGANSGIPEPIDLQSSKSIDSDSNVDEVQDLLQKFISNKSRKPPVKQDFYSPEQKAKSSEIDSSDLVTESLANLYLKQNLFEKARETFEKLSLQNPSKSAYFAARIQDVAEAKRSSS